MLSSYKVRPIDRFTVCTDTKKTFLQKPVCMLKGCGLRMNGCMQWLVYIHISSLRSAAHWTVEDPAPRYTQASYLCLLFIVACNACCCLCLNYFLSGLYSRPTVQPGGSTAYSRDNTALARDVGMLAVQRHSQEWVDASVLKEHDSFD